MILSIIRSTVKKEKRFELLQTIQSVEPVIRNTDGCLGIDVCQGYQNENSFIFLTKWNDEEKLMYHLHSEHFRALFGAMKFLCKTVDIKIHEVSEDFGNKLSHRRFTSNKRGHTPDCE